MSGFLEFLEDLAEPDVEWLLEHGQELRIKRGAEVIREGEEQRALFVVLQGLLEVRVAELQSAKYALRGNGEMVGDISFLLNQPASASVMAVEDSLLLQLPFELMLARCASHPEFGTRFYRSLARVNARRLLEAMARLTTNSGDGDSSGVEDSELWRRISSRIEQFKELSAATDRSAIQNRGIDGPTETAAVQEFTDFCTELNEAIGTEAGISEDARLELGRLTQRELLPFLLLTDTAERMYSKPRGYAGDYLTIQKIYENRASGQGRLGPLIDRCFLE